MRSSRTKMNPYGIFFHLKTGYLFIRSDIKTIFIPVPLFAFAVAPTFKMQLGATTVLWVLLHLLLIDVDNQSLAVEEDRQNKPWRPIPSGRISARVAQYIARALYLSCILLSFVVGGIQLAIVSVTFSALVFLYDHAELNAHWFWKNFINACGYATLESGASMILDPDFMRRQPTIYALAMSWSVIISTIHIQDLQDEMGDRRMNRQTFPIRLGQRFTRLSIVFFVLAWSVYLPAMWGIPVVSRGFFWVLGGWICFRICSCGKFDDGKSYQLYNVWIMSLHLLAAAPKMGMSPCYPDLTSTFLLNGARDTTAMHPVM